MYMEDHILLIIQRNSNIIHRPVCPTKSMRTNRLNILLDQISTFIDYSERTKSIAIMDLQMSLNYWPTQLLCTAS